MEKVFFETTKGHPAVQVPAKEGQIRSGDRGNSGHRKSRKDVVIVNKAGFHLRAVAEFARFAGDFPCSVTVRENGQIADGKSILSLLCLGAYCGVRITIEASGEKCEEAVEKLSALVESRFGGIM